MSQLFYGSIDVSTLIELARKKHSAFTKGTNGKIYASINVWLNDKQDKYGNMMSVQINPSKEMKELEDRVYIGNLKESERAKRLSEKEASDFGEGIDVPTRQYRQSSSAPTAGEITEPIDDLPF
jgi:hypothetical protein